MTLPSGTTTSGTPPISPIFEAVDRRAREVPQTLRECCLRKGVVARAQHHYEEFDFSSLLSRGRKPLASCQNVRGMLSRLRDARGASTVSAARAKPDRARNTGYIG